MAEKEKRKFKRYKKRHDMSALFFNGKEFRAEIIDYSLSGISSIVEDSPEIHKDSLVKIESNGLGLNITGRAVWKKQFQNHTRVGIEMPSDIKGSLKTFWLSDLLIDFQRSQKTGVLEIKDGSVIKKIYIQNGDMIFSASNQKADWLGDVLLFEGRINQKQYNDSVEMMKKTGKRQGAVLVELGYLKLSELPLAVKHQVERIILSLFAFNDGEFHFKEGHLPTDEIITLRLSTANLILKGIKTIKDMDYLRSLLPFKNTVPCLSPYPIDLFQDISLDDSQRKILSLIDGKKTLKDILSISPLGEFETLSSLCVLFATRIITDAVPEHSDIGPEIAPVAEDIGEPPLVVPEEVIRMIEDIYIRHESLGYYGVLGIKETAANEEIKKAFYKTAKEFHPDKHFYLPEDMRDKLNKIFSYVTNAYSTLTDPLQRKDYDRLLSQKSVKQASNAELAQERYIKGTAEFRRGNYHEAVRLFGEAAYLDKEVSKYHYRYGESLSRLGRLKEAEKAMQRALKIEPDNPNYLAEIGHIYLSLSLPLRAKANFEKALKLQPLNYRAQEGMKTLAQ